MEKQGFDWQKGGEQGDGYDYKSIAQHDDDSQDYRDEDAGLVDIGDIDNPIDKQQGYDWQKGQEQSELEEPDKFEMQNVYENPKDPVIDFESEEDVSFGSQDEFDTAWDLALDKAESGQMESPEQIWKDPDFDQFEVDTIEDVKDKLEGLQAQGGYITGEEQGFEPDEYGGGDLLQEGEEQQTVPDTTIDYFEDVGDAEGLISQLRKEGYTEEEIENALQRGGVDPSYIGEGELEDDPFVQQMMGLRAKLKKKFGDKSPEELEAMGIYFGPEGYHIIDKNNPNRDLSDPTWASVDAARDMRKTGRKNWVEDNEAIATEADQNEVNEFLDGLRESGVTNMFGAGSYIVDEFGVSKSEATQLLTEWMRTFGDRHPSGEATEGAYGSDTGKRFDCEDCGFSTDSQSKAEKHIEDFPHNVHEKWGDDDYAIRGTDEASARKDKMTGSWNRMDEDIREETAQMAGASPGLGGMDFYELEDAVPEDADKLKMFGVFDEKDFQSDEGGAGSGPEGGIDLDFYEGGMMQPSSSGEHPLYRDQSDVKATGQDKYLDMAMADYEDPSHQLYDILLDQSIFPLLPVLLVIYLQIFS